MKREEFDLNALRAVSKIFYEWLKEKGYRTYNGPSLGTTSRIKKMDFNLNKYTKRGYPDEGGIAITVDSWMKGPLNISLKEVKPKGDDWQEGWSNYREEEGIQHETFHDLIWHAGMLRNWQNPKNLLEYLKEIVDRFEGEHLDRFVAARRGADDLSDWEF